ncbi:hypothetical protein F4703DRAFT_1854652, partial [Phycomyces blakesleeanus]
MNKEKCVVIKESRTNLLTLSLSIHFHKESKLIVFVLFLLLLSITKIIIMSHLDQVEYLFVFFSSIYIYFFLVCVY